MVFSFMGNRRRPSSILQNRRVQIGLALMIVNYLIAYTAILFCVALAPNMIIGWTSPDELTSETLAQLSLFTGRVWPLSWLIIAGCGIHSIFMSHKVFGPITNVRRVANRVAEGDVSQRVRFRKGDMMDELRDDLNAMLDQLDSSLHGAQEAHAKIAGHIESVNAAAQQGSVSPQQIAALRSEAEALGSALQTFHTSHGDEDQTDDAAPEATDTMRAAA